MAELLEVSQVGNPVLRQIAQPVDRLNEPIQALIDSLMETLLQSNGVGIAAPQVAASYRLFIVASRPNPRYPNAPEMQPTVMINPRIITASDEILKDWEGCLSVPGIRGLVPRHRAIAVEYCDRQGKLQQQHLTEFVARIFQHELDHLNGMVFLDRLETNLDIVTDQEYLKRIAIEQVGS
ncbi:MAG: peptide deformylase [Timaviella obliquedivisa GSE-PSE-MK23-08B]|jgi:peptide deformylase|nr:peptide deformylase [Timaviella obliquedivisa GSE-PSE-MK23-08B]